jgi:hypothetical protein
MKIFLVILTLVVTLLGVALLYDPYILEAIPFLRRSRRGPSGERNASSSLKTLASAEADFRGNDRDGNKVEDFWRGDVAGLYTLTPPGSAEPIRLIEVSVAAADDRPITNIAAFAPRAPKTGYWYRAIRKKGEPPLKPSIQFAFCAFPSEYGRTGKFTYILDENNCVYKADLGHGRGLEVFPDDAELRRNWSKLD